MKYCSLIVCGIVLGLSGCKPSLSKNSSTFPKIIINVSSNPACGLVSIGALNNRFREQGLDVELKTYTTGKTALDQMLAGNGNFAVVAETPFATALLDKKEIQIVANIGSLDRSTAVVARRDHGISKPRDLAGKVLGVTKGTSSEYLGNLFLMANGMELSDVNISDLSPEKLISGIEDGSIDAACLWHPNLQIVTTKLGEKGITFESDVVYIWTLSLVAPKEFLQANPLAIRAVVRALIIAQDDYETGDDRILAMIAQTNTTSVEWLKSNSHNLRLSVSLNQSTISVLDDNLRWVARRNHLNPRNLPNPLDFVYWDALAAEKPESMTIIRPDRP